MTLTIDRTTAEAPHAYISRHTPIYMSTLIVERIEDSFERFTSRLPRYRYCWCEVLGVYKGRAGDDPTGFAIDYIRPYRGFKVYSARHPRQIARAVQEVIEKQLGIPVQDIAASKVDVEVYD